MRNVQRQMEIEESQDEAAGPSRSRQRIKEDKERSMKNKKLFTQLTHRRNKAVYTNLQAEKHNPVHDPRASTSSAGSIASDYGPRGMAGSIFDDGDAFGASTTVTNATMNPLAQADMISAMDMEEGDALMLKIAEEKQREMSRAVTAMQDLKVRADIHHYDSGVRHHACDVHVMYTRIIRASRPCECEMC